MFNIFTDINIYLSETFLISELVKYIYNRIAPHLFENEDNPKILANILKEILIKQKTYDLSLLKPKLECILTSLNPNTTENSTLTKTINKNEIS